MNERRFQLVVTAGTVRISVDGKLTEDTFALSQPEDLIYYLRSANLQPEEVDRILLELSTVGSSEFFLD